jgi:hypothetical protein
VARALEECGQMQSTDGCWILEILDERLARSLAIEVGTIASTLGH